MDEENKRSANQKIKELLLELNSNEVKRVEKALSALKVHGNKTVIRPLFEVLLISENEEINSQIWSFLHDLRDEKVIPEMMSCVLDEKYLSIRLNVLNSIWNSKIDYSAKSVHENYITLEVILAGIVAAIIWNLITWKKGIPSSSSHTLLGGFIGSALANAGTMSSHGVDVVNYSKVIPIFLFIFLAPMIGMFISYFITIAIMHICKRSNPKRAEKWFKKIQLLSSAMFSIGHGGNDAQKVMGIIGAAVVCYHIGIQDPAYANLENTERFNHFVNDWSWVPIISFTIIGLGTLSGGWSIIKTMGSKITKVTPIDGVAADTAGATTLFLSEHFGIPVSTTHTITGSIIGVGITKRLSAVRWRVAV